MAYRTLHFDDGVNGLDRHVQAGGMRKHRRGLNPIVNHDIDLPAALAFRIYHKAGTCTIAPGQEFFEKVEPRPLGGISSRSPVPQQRPNG